jgi:peptide deformylase
MLQIVTAPHPVLSEKAKPISKIDKDILELIEKMKVTLAHTKDPEGVGLAAPQVGKSLQIFLVRQTDRSPFLVFINPTIKPLQIGVEQKAQPKPASKSAKGKKDESVKLEGCLSLPDIWGEVKRSPAVEITYQDESGATHTKTFKGFAATILQHEFDHLQGVLFPKHVFEQGGTLYKSEKNEKGETIFKELEI